MAEVIDPVMLLRDALQPELLNLIKVAKTVTPTLDATTLGSLLMLFGIEVGLTTGNVSGPQMAAYLHMLADAIENDDDALPTLGRQPPRQPTEPLF